MGQSADLRGSEGYAVCTWINNRRSFLWRGICSLLIIYQLSFHILSFFEIDFWFFKIFDNDASNSCLLSSSYWPGRWRPSVSCLPSCVCTQAELSPSPAQLSCVHDWFHLCWCNVMNSAAKSGRNGSASHIEERNVRVTIDWCDRLSRTAGNTWNNSTDFEQKLPHSRQPLTH